jgi:hypothetical protein
VHRRRLPAGAPSGLDRRGGRPPQPRAWQAATPSPPEPGPWHDPPARSWRMDTNRGLVSAHLPCRAAVTSRPSRVRFPATTMPPSLHELSAFRWRRSCDRPIPSSLRRGSPHCGGWLSSTQSQRSARFPLATSAPCTTTLEPAATDSVSLTVSGWVHDDEVADGRPAAGCRPVLAAWPGPHAATAKDAATSAMVRARRPGWYFFDRSASPRRRAGKRSRFRCSAARGRR